MVIVPGLKKGAFVVGAKYGRGFVSCRTGAGWSAPAGHPHRRRKRRVPVGGAEVDVVLAIMNKRGVGSAAVEQVHARSGCRRRSRPGRADGFGPDRREDDGRDPVVVRSRGVFAGVALEGATLRGDDNANRDLYGRTLSVREIVTGGTPVPPAAQALIDRLAKF